LNHAHRSACSMLNPQQSSTWKLMEPSLRLL
jgi:hypothetical protein